MLKNISAAKAIGSKAIIGGLVLIVGGGFLLYKGEYELGMVAIGNGLGIIGIRDNSEKPRDW